MSDRVVGWIAASLLAVAIVAGLAALYGRWDIIINL